MQRCRWTPRSTRSHFGCFDIGFFLCQFPSPQASEAVRMKDQRIASTEEREKQIEDGVMHAHVGKACRPLSLHLKVPTVALIPNQCRNWRPRCATNPISTLSEQQRYPAAVHNQLELLHFCIPASAPPLQRFPSIKASCHVLEGCDFRGMHKSCSRDSE